VVWNTSKAHQHIAAYIFVFWMAHRAIVMASQVVFKSQSWRQLLTRHCFSTVTRGFATEAVKISPENERPPARPNQIMRGMVVLEVRGG
jgi:hypothetical protein